MVTPMHEAPLEIRKYKKLILILLQNTYNMLIIKVISVNSR